MCIFIFQTMKDFMNELHLQIVRLGRNADIACKRSRDTLYRGSVRFLDESHHLNQVFKHFRAY